MATTLSYLDSYCERAGNAALLAEPLNLVTNLFFVAGALVAIYLIMRLPPEPTRKRIDLSLLALSLLSIGIGSGLWHLAPSQTTMLMDVIPITLFIHIYLVAAMRRILEYSWPKVVFCWAIYMGVSIAAQLALSPDLFNGTIMYIPTYATLVVLAIAVALRNRYLGRVFGAVLLVWTASLVFRTIDHEICKTLTMGTHFMWHSLNAWVLYRLLLALIRYRPPVTIPVVE